VPIEVIAVSGLLNMQRAPRKTAALISVALWGMIGCSLKDQPLFLERRRPANVPADASLVDMPKGGVWQHCTFDSAVSANRCQIYNWGGEVLYDEVFLPYDGGPPILQADLKIPRYLPSVGLGWVCLKNGRILLPKSRFEDLKKFLDRTSVQKPKL
jgi:hypothetical protein